MVDPVGDLSLGAYEFGGLEADALLLLPMGVFTSIMQMLYFIAAASVLFSVEEAESDVHIDAEPDDDESDAWEPLEGGSIAGNIIPVYRRMKGPLIVVLISGVFALSGLFSLFLQIGEWLVGSVGKGGGVGLFVASDLLASLVGGSFVFALFGTARRSVLQGEPADGYRDVLADALGRSPRVAAVLAMILPIGPALKLQFGLSLHPILILLATPVIYIVATRPDRSIRGAIVEGLRWFRRSPVRILAAMTVIAGVAVGVFMGLGRLLVFLETGMRPTTLDESTLAAMLMNVAWLTKPVVILLAILGLCATFFTIDAAEADSKTGQGA